MEALFDRFNRPRSPWLWAPRRPSPLKCMYIRTDVHSRRSLAPFTKNPLLLPHNHEALSYKLWYAWAWLLQSVGESKVHSLLRSSGRIIDSVTNLNSNLSVGRGGTLFRRRFGLCSEGRRRETASVENYSIMIIRKKWNNYPFQRECIIYLNNRPM